MGVGVKDIENIGKVASGAGQIDKFGDKFIGAYSQYESSLN